jgi:hypothetical protein
MKRSCVNKNPTKVITSQYKHQNVSVMKKIILPTILVAVTVWSCTTAYKTMTPDDVYYSPARELKGAQDRYDEYAANSDDHYLRMKVHDRYRWNTLDDFSYWNDPRYDFGYSCMPSREVLLNPYNPYMGIGYSMYYAPWYNWYSPYTTIVYYRNPKVYGNTSKTNLTAYRNGLYNNGSNSRQSVGSLFKQAFSNTNNSSYYPYNNNSSTRTFNSGVTPSSSAGGRSGGFNSTGSSANTSRGPR